MWGERLSIQDLFFSFLLMAGCVKPAGCDCGFNRISGIFQIQEMLEIIKLKTELQINTILHIYTIIHTHTNILFCKRKHILSIVLSFPIFRFDTKNQTKSMQLLLKPCWCPSLWMWVWVCGCGSLTLWIHRYVIHYNNNKQPYLQRQCFTLTVTWVGLIAYATND